jgi:uncharacterized protein (DUF433 family)
MILHVGAAAAQEAPPRGHYLANEVGDLAGVSGNTIGQWERREYIRASQQTHGYPLVYAYQDIAEAMVVHELMNRGVNLRYIKEALQKLRDMLGTEWPLQQAKILVPDLTPGQLRSRRGKGRTVAFQKDDGEILDLIRNHAVLPKSDLVSIAADLKRGGWAAREIGDDLKHIEVDPDRLSGQPTIRGRRLSARLVANLAETDEGLKELRSKDGYDLKTAEIRDAQRWWGKVRTYQEAA